MYLYVECGMSVVPNPSTLEGHTSINTCHVLDNAASTAKLLVSPLGFVLHSNDIYVAMYIGASIIHALRSIWSVFSTFDYTAHQ
jgi:hypothetical protein